MRRGFGFCGIGRGVWVWRWGRCLSLWVICVQRRRRFVVVGRGGWFVRGCRRVRRVRLGIVLRWLHRQGVPIDTVRAKLVGKGMA